VSLVPAPDSTAPAPHTLVIGCGALARELLELARALPGVEVACIDAQLHMRPERIAGAVAARIARARRELGPDIRVFVAYADCGTRGALDDVLAAEGVDRLEGAHCYEFYAGSAAFAALQEEELGTFYLTDFLARQFETLVIAGLGLDRHPELLPLYFGNYRRLVYLAQTDDPLLTERARSAATRLGLTFERRETGMGELRPAIRALADPAEPEPLPDTSPRGAGQGSVSHSRGARAGTGAGSVSPIITVGT
jgi:hypothetical protein